MLFTDWVEREGRGAMKHIADADLRWFKGDVPSGGKALVDFRENLKVSYKTVYKSGKCAIPIRDHPTAEKISKLTGGECSIPEIVKPREHMTRAKRERFIQLDRIRERERQRRRSAA